MGRTMLSMVIVGVVANTLPAEVSINAPTYADHYGDSLRVVEDYLAHISRGYWVKYEDVTFDAGYSMVEIIHAGENDGGLLFVAGPLDGGIQMTNVCTTRATGDWHTFDTSTFEAVTPAEGTHDVFIEFSLGGFFGEGVGNFRNFTFTAPSSLRPEPTAWGTTDATSSMSPRLSIDLSAYGPMNKEGVSEHGTLAIYDVRGRIARVIMPAARTAFTRSSGRGLNSARQAIVLVPAD